MLRKSICVSVIGVAGGLMSLTALAGNGNMAPPGPHYNLNLIAVPPKTVCADLTGPSETCNGNGHRIFVKTSGNTKIALGNSGEAGSYYVTDWNGTDGYAEFFLPNPDSDCDGTTSYSVYARALGKGGKATMTTCAYDWEEAYDYCSTDNIVEVFDRTNKRGQSTFTNVSAQLLYVTYDGKRYPLFGDSTADYYWNYDNDGLKMAQLRFYEISTEVATDANTLCGDDIWPDPPQ